MKKAGLAAFWLAQYAFGVLAMVQSARQQPLWALAFILASFGSVRIGGKLLGIEEGLTVSANAAVPWMVQKLWVLICNGLLLLLVLDVLGAGTIAGVKVSPGFVVNMMILYTAAALRDLFLASFYFRQEL